MLPGTQRLQSFLQQAHVPFTTIPHARVYTAQETAARTHTPGRDFAKAILLRVDRSYVLAVLPAHRSVDIDCMRTSLQAQSVALANELEMRVVCPDCETGAMSPFGHLYDIPVYVDQSLTEEEDITFNAGSHEEAIRMSFRDYARLARPRVLDLCVSH